MPEAYASASEADFVSYRTRQAVPNVGPCGVAASVGGLRDSHKASYCRSTFVAEAATDGADHSSSVACGFVSYAAIAVALREGQTCCELLKAPVIRFQREPDYWPDLDPERVSSAPRMSCRLVAVAHWLEQWHARRKGTIPKQEEDHWGSLPSICCLVGTAY